MVLPLLCVALSTAHAVDPDRVVAWGSLGAGVAFDALGWSSIVRGAMEPRRIDEGGVATFVGGTVAVGGASVFRNLSVGLALADAKKAGVDRNLGGLALGFSVGATLAFWSLPATSGQVASSADPVIWWPATNLGFRAVSDSLVGAQLIRSARGTDGERQAQLHIRPDGLSVAGRF